MFKLCAFITLGCVFIFLGFYCSLVSGDAYLKATNVLRVHFIHVGYGSAILVQPLKGESVVIDAGPEEAGEYLAYYLKSQKIDRLDKIFLTHPHRDHFGGLNKIIASFPLKEFFGNGDSLHAHAGYDKIVKNIKKHGITITRGGIILTWEWRAQH